MILRIICQTTGMGFAAVARVIDERWVACEVLDQINFGLKPGDEARLDKVSCPELHRVKEPVIIEHVAEDRVCSFHHTPPLGQFKSYISLPITLEDGQFFGTLCAIDPKPNRINTPEIVGMFKLFCELIAFHFHAQEQRASSALRLQEERKETELREQFIALLGHDLRNPLGAISSGAEFLKLTPLDEMAVRVVDAMQRSVVRMSALINDVLDFARGRLGSGVDVSRRITTELEPALNQVIDGLAEAWPGRQIVTHYLLSEPVNCDISRIAQLFSNLLSNALTYGAVAQPIHVRAISKDGAFELSVANAGSPISASAQERLFQPFFRGEEQPKQQGLGLGLYIAAEIARAHGGKLMVTSTPEETRFTLRMPNA